MKALKILKIALLVGVSLFIVMMLHPVETSQATNLSGMVGISQPWNIQPDSLDASGIAAPSCEPKIDIRKQEEGPDTRRFSSGSDVHYEIAVTNTGDVELSNVVVTDTLVMDCNHDIGSLAIAEVYTYTCEMPNVIQGFTNIAAVQGEGNGIKVFDEDPSTVEIEPSSKYNITVGFEDLRMVSESDFDYNDWVVSILTEMHGVYVAEDTIELEKITFNITPQARGAGLGHEFHLRFFSNTFEYDGVVELLIQDTTGNIPEPKIYTYTFPETTDFVINFDMDDPDTHTLHPCTCEAFGDHREGYVHNMRNTKQESVEFNGPARRTAVLSITFDTPVTFDLPSYAQHCQGLFFDPHLHVASEDPYDITRTPDIDDPNPERRILCVKDPNWQWPEERIRIDRAYPRVLWLGEPEFVNFDSELPWNQCNNSCVFDDERCVYKPCDVTSILYLPMMARYLP
ncbi:MAG TPA: hypothetical protein VLA49_01760 [Anaerolineales bacterium]|nr:hypothetical protein [Anaerolineales bacterium]